MGAKKKTKMLILVIAGAAVLTGTVLAAVLLARESAGRRALQEKIDLGSQYLGEEDYEQALSAYGEAVKRDPSSVAAYRGLAEAYAGLGDYERALAALKEGVEATGSGELAGQLEKLRAEYEALLAAQEEAGKAAEEEGGQTAEETASDGRNGQVMTVEQVLAAKVGDIVTFGAYEQDNNLDNGPEPIEWYVLEKADGEVVLLSVYLLDDKQYNEAFTGITWEDCTLRAWLNGAFFEAAFNETEAAAIRLTGLVNEDNPFWDTPGGNDTYDRIFLLSLGEIGKYFGIPMTRETNPWYNLSMDWQEYALYCYEQDARILGKPTAYAQAQGAYAMSEEEAASYAGQDFSHAAGCGYWWSRSPGAYSDSAAVVDYDGYVYDYGDEADCYNNGVRPAVKLGY